MEAPRRTDPAKGVGTFSWTRLAGVLGAGVVAMLADTAAALSRTAPDASLDTVGQIADALTPVLGETGGRLVFGRGVAGALFIVGGVNVVSLSVGVQGMNALLLPIVLGFLFLLARRLPEAHRLAGPWAGVIGAVMAVTVALGLDSGIAGLWN